MELLKGGDMVPEVEPHKAVFLQAYCAERNDTSRGLQGAFVDELDSKIVGVFKRRIHWDSMLARCHEAQASELRAVVDAVVESKDERLFVSCMWVDWPTGGNVQVWLDSCWDKVWSAMPEEHEGGTLIWFEDFAQATLDAPLSCEQVADSQRAHMERLAKAAEGDDDDGT